MVCPTHPEVVSERRGICPICGMALEAETEAANPAKRESSDGQCCGQPAAPARQQVPRPSSATSYTCPMHPEIVRGKPGACPICGMALEPVTASLDDAPNNGAARHGRHGGDDVQLGDVIGNALSAKTARRFTSMTASQSVSPYSRNGARRMNPGVVDDLIAILQRLCEAIVRVQDPKSSVWWQVVDQPGREKNYLESSASAMFTYVLLKSSRLGYIEAKYNAVGRRAYSGLLKEFIDVDKNGLVTIHRAVQVVGLGGDPEKERYRDGSYEYYVTEKVRDNDPKAVGPFIFASMEMEGR